MTNFRRNRTAVTIPQSACSADSSLYTREPRALPRQFNKLEFEGGYTMAGNIVTFLVGVVCIVLGISNMRGNISSLHSYHRSRVSEEDRIPFGKQVGLGTIIVGIGIIVFSVLSSVTLYTENDIFILVGTAVLIIGIILGLVISFRAMIKYNKGIF